MGKNSRGRIYHYDELKDIFLVLGDAHCASGLTPEMVHNMVEVVNPELYNRISRGYAAERRGSIKYISVTLDYYTDLAVGRGSYSDPPFLKLSSAGERRRYTLKPEIWERHRRQQAENKAAARRERERTRRQNYQEQRQKDITALEGAQVQRADLRRERGVVALAFKRQLTSFRCEVCDFSFVEHYGADARNFIEAHHKYPLSFGRRLTKVADFNAVCANCHRMLHSRGLRTVSELKRVVNRHRPK